VIHKLISFRRVSVGLLFHPPSTDSFSTSFRVDTNSSLPPKAREMEQLVLMNLLFLFTP
jgi:hypothetical protein